MKIRVTKNSDGEYVFNEAIDMSKLIINSNPHVPKGKPMLMVNPHDLEVIK